MKNICLVALMAIFFVIGGCKKDSRLGFDLIVEDSDETEVLTYSDISTIPITKDTVISTNNGFGLVGQVNDPIFGTTQAGFTMQFELGKTTPVYEYIADGDTTKVPYGRSFKIDSLELYIGYNMDKTRKNTMGKENSAQKLSFYQLNSQLNDSNFLHTDINTFISDEKLGEGLHTYQKDNEAYFKAKLTNATFIQHFQDNIMKAIQSSTEFQSEILRGIAVKNTDDSNEMLNLFWIYSDSTRLRMYYSNDKIADGDVAYHDFPSHYDVINNNIVYDVATSRFYTFTNYDYSTSEFASILDKTNTTSDKAVYVQSLGGVRTLITFPGIKTWLQAQPDYIRKAHLIIRPNKSLEDAAYTTIDKLLLYKKAEGGVEAELPEYIQPQTNGSRTYQYESYDEVDDEFRFDITSYIQAINNNEAIQDDGLILKAYSPLTTLGRSVLHSSGDDTSEGYRIQLRITYSKAVTKQ